MRSLVDNGNLFVREFQVKEEESSTLEVVQNIQSITVTLQKAKDMCLQKGLELEKLRKDNASQRELEKSEVKYKKAQDDYKALVDKYTVVRNDFESKMTQACRVHIRYRKTFLVSNLFSPFILLFFILFRRDSKTSRRHI